MDRSKLFHAISFLVLIYCTARLPLAGDDAISRIIKSRTSEKKQSPTDIIVDNTDARVKGDWTTGDTAEDRYGKDYLFHEAGDGKSRVLYRPPLSASGLYDIYEWHSEGENRTGAAEIVIRHADGETRLSVNQKTGGGSWNFLGRVSLDPEKDHYIEVTDRFEGEKGDVAIADAFRFVPVGSGQSAPSTPSKKPSPRKTPSPASRRKIRPFREYVREVIDELEKRKARDVSGYLMKDKWGKYTGVTETLRYRGVSYMWNECKPGEWVRFSDGKKEKPYGKSYCSGLTLEIFHKAMKRRDRDMGIPEGRESWNGLGPKGIFIVKKLWNVIHIKYKDTGKRVTKRPCPATALELSGLGRVITYGDSSLFEKVLPYDFCDISRSTGYGHSIIFVSWIRSKKTGAIIGFRYYSTQKKTGGQGYRTEYFKGSGGKVLKSQFHAGRVYDNPESWTENKIREADYE